MPPFPFNGMKHPRKHRAARDKTEITHRSGRRARARSLSLPLTASANSYLDELHNARTQGTFYPDESLTDHKTTIIDGKRPVHPPRNYRRVAPRSRCRSSSSRSRAG